MNRRSFLKTTAVFGILGFALKSVNLWGGERKKTENPPPHSGKTDLVAVRGGEPVAMYAKAIAELGGMEAFVKKGNSVVIKPNMAWDRPPEMAANTNPELVAAVIRDCLKAGASKVYVFDTTCSPWKDAYKNSGVEAAAKAAGAVVIGGDSRNPAYLKEWYEDYDIPNAAALKHVKLHKLIRSCDVFINIPVAKHHSGAQMTCCMKNLMGTVAKQSQQQCHAHLQESIADLMRIRKPDLNIVDAYRVMTKRGPRGVDESDVRTLKYLLAGCDPVALDTSASRLLNFRLSKIKHILFGERSGFGTTNLKNLNIKRITM